MLPAHHFLTVWAFLGANILSPGPNVLNTITTALGSGRAAGLASAAGVGVGIAGWCLGMSLGMAAVFVLVPGLQTALTLVAVGLLVWFASRYLRAAWAGFAGNRDRLPKGVAGIAPGASFLRSLGVNALNPKALTSWLAILAIFPVAEAGAADIALLCAGTCVLAAGIHTVYALLFSAPAAARLYLRAAPWISGAAGLFFSLFAVRILALVLAG